MSKLTKLCRIITVAIVCGCSAANSTPPIPVQPVVDGDRISVYSELTHDSKGLATEEYLGGLIENPVSIDKARIIFYQYEGCYKVERGRVTVKPSTPPETLAVRGGGYLFMDVYFTCSNGTGRVDHIIHLQKDTDYSVRTVYDEKSPYKFSVEAYRRVQKKGELHLEPVKLLTYREGLKAVLLNCRKEKIE